MQFKTLSSSISLALLATTTLSSFAEPSLPILVTENYIDIDKIQEISRFRSDMGHDFSDSFETCRSMKHYFRPKAGVAIEEINIYAPFHGTVLIRDDGFDTKQIEIFSSGADTKNYSARIFHVIPDPALIDGQSVGPGEILGTHGSYETMSDIAITEYLDGGLNRKISYFDVMEPMLFARLYPPLGIANLETLIISKEARDNDPLGCTQNGAFTTTGQLLNISGN